MDCKNTIDQALVIYDNQLDQNSAPARKLNEAFWSDQIAMYPWGPATVTIHGKTGDRALTSMISEDGKAVVGNKKKITRIKLEGGKQIDIEWTPIGNRIAFYTEE